MHCVLAQPWQMDTITLVAVPIGTARVSVLCVLVPFCSYCCCLAAAAVDKLRALLPRPCQTPRLLSPLYVQSRPVGSCIGLCS
jgi:hypothetical protein